MVNRLPGKSLIALLALVACIPLAHAVESPALNTGSTAWMVTATVLLLFKCLRGLALFHGGLVRAKNMLSLFTQCFGIAGLVGVLWLIYGYSIVVDAHSQRLTVDNSLELFNQCKDLPVNFLSRSLWTEFFATRSRKFTCPNP